MTPPLSLINRLNLRRYALKQPDTSVEHMKNAIHVKRLYTKIDHGVILNCLLLAVASALFSTGAHDE